MQASKLPSSDSIWQLTRHLRPIKECSRASHTSSRPDPRPEAIDAFSCRNTLICDKADYLGSGGCREFRPINLRDSPIKMQVLPILGLTGMGMMIPLTSLLRIWSPSRHKFCNLNNKSYFIPYTSLMRHLRNCQNGRRKSFFRPNTRIHRLPYYKNGPP